MRISDWSADVCASDLDERRRYQRAGASPDRVERPGLLRLGKAERRDGARLRHLPRLPALLQSLRFLPAPLRPHRRLRDRRARRCLQGGLQRSEEHTSELQSLMRISYAVFCLKKKKHQRHDYSILKKTQSTPYEYYK